MGKVNIKQLNVAPASGYVIGSGAGGVPVWKTEVTSVAWNQITGNQADINLSGFTNNAGFITLGSLSAGTGISYNNLTGVITNSAPDQTVVLTQGTGITITGTYPNFTVASNGNQTITLSGDVTGSGTTAISTTLQNGVVTPLKIADGAVQTAKIADNAVSNAKIRTSAGLSIIGRSANSTGNVADITSTINGHFLVQRSNALTWGALEVADIPTGIDHGGLSGLADDDHTQYALLAGRSTGQTLIGGSASLTLVGGTGTTADLNFKTTTGVGVTGADMHFLVGNNGATEAMTILNSGFIGINKTDPSGPLELNRSDYSGRIVFSQGAVTDKSVTSAFADSNGACIQQIANGFLDSGGSLNQYNSAKPSWRFQLDARSTQDNFNVARTAPAGVTTTYFRIIGNGDVGINTLSPTTKLHVAGDIQVETAFAFYLGAPTTDGTWRIIRSGNDLLSQRRESGVYVTKQTITP